MHHEELIARDKVEKNIDKFKRYILSQQRNTSIRLLEKKIILHKIILDKGKINVGKDIFNVC